jgi:diguanylate cyclase (GGDEF)-like protein
MPTTETLLTVILMAILVAILVNVALGAVLLVAPRFRRKATAGATAEAMATLIANASAPSSGRFGIGAFGPVDPDTGFDLPATWSRWVEEEDARIRRYRRSATVVLVEVQGFDRVADRIGEDAASRLIPPVALNLSRHARETDRFARLGPARFGALMLETDEVQAINYVERIRSACDSWLEAGGVASRLTIGWAEANTSHSIEAAVEQAEDRLNADRHQRFSIRPDDDLLEGVPVSA